MLRLGDYSLDKDELEKMEDLWQEIQQIKDARWKLMLKLFYKINDNLMHIEQNLIDMKNYLSAIAEK